MTKIVDTFLHASREQYAEHLLAQKVFRILHRPPVHSAASVLLVPLELARTRRKCYLRHGCTNPRR